MKNVIENFAMVIAVILLIILGGLMVLILWAKSLIGFKNQINESDLKDDSTLYRGWAYQPNLFDIETTHGTEAKRKSLKVKQSN
jgi:high-affinity Fe2+/Pb2+ permease